MFGLVTGEWVLKQQISDGSYFGEWIMLGEHYPSAYM